MAEFPLSDPLLAELWRARPDGPDRLADEAAGVALLERLVSTDPNASNGRTDSPGSRELLPRVGPGRGRLRRVAIGAVAAAAVAGAVTAGLFAAGPGGHEPAATSALTVQAVAQRTKVALTAALTQDVEYSVTKTTYPQTEAIPSRTSYEWTNGTKTNIEVVNPTGAPFEDVWYSGRCEATSGATEVLYPIQTWWTKTVAVTVTQVQDVTGRDISNRIQGWVDSGQLTVVGTPTVSGQQTIEVSGDALTLGQAACTRPAATASTRQFALTMWLNPSTYLPVQLTTTYTTPANAAATTSTTSTVSWLPATSANLVKLQGQIPSGFTHATGQLLAA